VDRVQTPERLIENGVCFDAVQVFGSCEQRRFREFLEEVVDFRTRGARASEFASTG
jgi:hypothetical protein